MVKTLTIFFRYPYSDLPNYPITMRYCLIAIISGALLPLAFAPFNFWYVGLASLAVLSWLWIATSRPALLGFCFGLGYFGAGLHWVYISMAAFGGAPLMFAVLANGLLVLVLALFPTITGLMLHFFSKPGSWLRALLIPFVWMLAEYARSFVLGGFPWLSVGYSQLAAPLEGLAPLGGVFAIGFVLMMIATCIGKALYDKSLPALCVAVILLLISIPTRQLSFTTPVGQPFSVALVQGNIPQLTKFDSGLMHMHIGYYIDLSIRRSESVIIWPETAIAFMEDDIRDSTLEPLDRLLKQRGQTLVSGIPAGDLGAGIYYNAVIALGKGQGRYYKHHLLPFGEYLPLRSIFAIFEEYVDIPLSDFSRGEARQAPLITQQVPAGVSICFEAAFGRDIRRALPQAQYLINVSNDGWFEDSIAADQHLQMNQMRALEMGREMARATNNGITVFIDDKGRVSKALPRFERGVLSGYVQPRIGMTPYATHGDNIFLLLLAVYGLFLFAVGFAARAQREW